MRSSTRRRCAETWFAAPGFTYPDGSQAELFSSDNAAVVLRHFQWMRDYGIDGAFQQRFLVGLPGGPVAVTYDSNLRVLHHVAAAAQRTGAFGRFPTTSHRCRGSYRGFAYSGLIAQTCCPTKFFSP